MDAGLEDVFQTGDEDDDFNVQDSPHEDSLEDFVPSGHEEFGLPNAQRVENTGENVNDDEFELDDSEPDTPEPRYNLRPNVNPPERYLGAMPSLRRALLLC